MQLNKIRQTEWNGLEHYLRVYFAEELKPKPDSGTIDRICEEHGLKRRRILVIGNTGIDSDFADGAGLDFVDVSDFKAP
jgi:phosphoglycolate phosphatase-like HAD superfamily hydrolase